MNNDELKRHAHAIDDNVRYLIANADTLIDVHDWRRYSSDVSSLLASTSNFLRSYMLTVIDECGVSPTCLLYGDPSQRIYAAHDGMPIAYLPAKRLAEQIERCTKQVKADTGSSPLPSAIDEAIAVIVLERFIKLTKSSIAQSYRQAERGTGRPSTDDVTDVICEYIEENPIS